MSLHIIKTSQALPVSLKEAWDFISSPNNLTKITPPYMGFEITSEVEEKIYEGMIITYKVRPFLNFPFNWTTEITYMKEPFYFVDEQRHGPYKFWHHKHFLEEINGGVLMRDLIHYKLPLGVAGDIVNTLKIKRQLDAIFDFREQKLIELFGKFGSSKF